MGSGRDVGGRPLFDLGATKAFEGPCRDGALSDREVRLRFHSLVFVLVSTLSDTVPLPVAEVAYIPGIGAGCIALSHRLGVAS